ncbi:Dabb family protein [Pleomorphomonas sp. NRK KF1]|uniref:Dabb family protein n=1 Tax=Pleomorphomonas sp. NRK KF1 TaxID=2943000 RepID=UPI00204344BD|nr:Dabb family protein [Pleomorphomonas sp. NRK KF1]MCM5554627.1 Dabb family protein [Pleomorphomonas sp. NRK KF1]
MIRHIVYFSVRSTDDRQRVLEGLRLLEANPHALILEVEENLKLDSIGNEVDFVVYGEFADATALDAFKAHPSYEASIAAVRPLRELRMAADVVARTERQSS